MNRVWMMLWRWGDLVYRRVRHFDFEDRDGDNVMRIRVRCYKGPSFVLPDGEQVRSGEWIGFLHLYNFRLQQLLQGIKSENRRTLLMAREVKRSLPGVAEFMRTHPRGERIKALIGVTLLNRGVEPLGFQVQDVPDTRWFRFKNWYMLRMMALCHPEGRKRLKRRSEALVLKRVVMLKRDLFRRYGKV